MVELLEKAFAEVARLPKDQQEAFARWILDELHDEEHWNAAFSTSLDKLEMMGRDALAAYRAGKTEELDPDTLE